MNYVLIITIIIIIILLYVLWRFFSNNGTKLTTNADLNKTQSVPITINNTSVQYAYGVWIYVNSWTPGKKDSSKKTIFSRSANKNDWETGKYSTHLYLDPVSPTLYLDIAQNGKSTTPPITISSNFPIQKWCYVVFSVNNQYVDCYLDGKLVKSVYLSGPLATIGGDVYLGPPSGGIDIYLNKFYYWANPLTPQVVWSNYLSGNGNNPLSALSNTIGFGFAFYRDNVESSTFRLF
jgi:hypothetical protein